MQYRYNLMTRKRDHLNKLQNYLFSYLWLLFWFNRWGWSFSCGRSYTAIRQISVMKKLLSKISFEQLNGPTNEQAKKKCKQNRSKLKILTNFIPLVSFHTP